MAPLPLRVHAACAPGLALTTALALRACYASPESGGPLDPVSLALLTALAWPPWLVVLIAGRCDRRSR